ncbi:MAG: nucleotidyl transferase AbiEii/AbiGii toxin family protein [Candidatus Thorarchaeota archaeon]
MRRILVSLYEFDIRYLLVGGLAINLYGIPRTTADIDILLDLSDSNLVNFIQCMKDLGLKLKQPVNESSLLQETYRKALRTEKNVVVLTYENTENPLEIIDFFIENPISFENAYNRKETLYVNHYEIYLAAVDDLIALKRISGRESDLADIENLEQLRELRNEDT